MARVPFKVREFHAGLSEASGVAFVEDDFLVFQVQVKTLGFKREPETIKVERPVVEQMRLQRGIFNDKLCIVPKKLSLLEVFPGNHRAELTLKVSRRYRDEAERLIRQVMHDAAPPREA